MDQPNHGRTNIQPARNHPVSDRIPARRTAAPFVGSPSAVPVIAGTQVATIDVDVAVGGQLPVAQLAFDNTFEPGSLQMKRLEKDCLTPKDEEASRHAIGQRFGEE